ncbi:MAG: hypothetical protein JXB32_09180 [Deltaproteobacteria bacterium]|nr:hypothetical protein [Deltaproteobacteria bacterium]
MTRERTNLVPWLLGSAALAFAGCVDAEGEKTPLEPPAITDADEGSADWVSLTTDVIGEFRYYGETVEGEFLRRGYVGIAFQAKAGETIALEVEALTEHRDTVIWLYPPVDEDDPWGEVWRRPIASNDDIEWPTNSNSAIVDFPLTQDGRYLLVVAEYRGRTGRFQATLRCTGGGCLEPLPPETRCGRLGGYCTYFLTECEAGFVGANEAGQMLECEGGRSAKCCVPEDPNPYGCAVNDDCVAVNADCCGCSMGGTSVAVNRAFADAAGPDPATCAGIMCTAVYNCWGAPACIDGLCSLIAPDSPESRCLAAGGAISTASCCLSTGDFPNLCRIGPCGCSPANSHEIRVCDCGEGRCFDGTTCVGR